MEHEPATLELALRAIFSLVFVVGLIVVCGHLIRRYGWDRKWTVGHSGKPRRLSVEESLYLDPRHRLLLVRCDEGEHLILISQGNALLIASQPCLLERGTHA